MLSISYLPTRKMYSTVKSDTLGTVPNAVCTPPGDNNLILSPIVNRSLRAASLPIAIPFLKLINFPSEDSGFLIDDKISMSSGFIPKTSSPKL